MTYDTVVTGVNPGSSHHKGNIFLPIFKKDFIHLILEKGGGREKEKETNSSVQEIHWSVASCTHLAGDLGHNPGMSPDQEIKLVTLQLALMPLSHTSQGSFIFLCYLCEKVDVSWTHCGHHFTVYVNQTTMQCALNLHSKVCQLFFNKTGKKEGTYAGWSTI